MALESRVRVTFTHDTGLNLLVPATLTEKFWIPRGRGTGRARYTNFRRFPAAGRLVP